MTFSQTRRYVAEFIGTAMLLATVVGSGIMAQKLAEGNDAIAPLGNTIATAAILFVLITNSGLVSGAHFNPAVTLIFYLRRELPKPQAIVYVAAQVAGAVPGSRGRTSACLSGRPGSFLPKRERGGGNGLPKQSQPLDYCSAVWPGCELDQNRSP